MHVAHHHTLDELRQHARKQHKARPRLRTQAVILALEGKTAANIAAALGAAERSVCSWIGRYNELGLEGLQAYSIPGRPCRLDAKQLERLRKRLDNAPKPKDKVCTLRGQDIQRILQQEFGETYCLQGIYKLLHRLGYSSLMPRPQHTKADPQAQEAFKKSSHRSSRTAKRTPGSRTAAAA